MFTKDSQTENFLTLHGVDWKYTNAVPVKSLAKDWDMTNWGRSKPRVEDAILEYSARMEGGSAAPAPILWKIKDGYEVLDGVQRISAAMLGDATRISAYVITTDSKILARTIRVFANISLSGHTETPEWSRLQAVQLLIIEGGMSVSEVARIGGWKAADIHKSKEFLDWSHAICSIGGPQKLTQGVVCSIAKHARMSDLARAPEPIASLCNDLKAGKFNNGDSEDLIAKFFSNVNRKDPNRMHSVFAKRHQIFRKDPDVSTRLTGRRKQKITPEINLRRHLLSTQTVVDNLVATGEYIPYMEEFHKIWNDVNKGMKLLAKKTKKKSTVKQ